MRIRKFKFESGADKSFRNFFFNKNFNFDPVGTLQFKQNYQFYKSAEQLF